MPPGPPLCPRAALFLVWPPVCNDEAGLPGAAPAGTCATTRNPREKPGLVCTSASPPSPFPALHTCHFLTPPCHPGVSVAPLKGDLGPQGVGSGNGTKCGFCNRPTGLNPPPAASGPEPGPQCDVPPFPDSDASPRVLGPMAPSVLLGQPCPLLSAPGPCPGPPHLPQCLAPRFSPP